MIWLCFSETRKDKFLTKYVIPMSVYIAYWLNIYDFFYFIPKFQDLSILGKRLGGAICVHLGLRRCILLIQQ